MSISGTYYIKKWIPESNLVHGEGFNPGGPGGGPGGPGGPGGMPEGMPPMGGPGGPGGPGGMPEGMPPMGGPGGPAPAGPQVELKDYGQPPENFFEGEITLKLEAHPQKEGLNTGTLTGTSDGDPIKFGFYTGDEFFKVDYPAGPGEWEIWARVDKEGYVEGMVSFGGGGGGFPCFCYGRKID